MKKRMKYSCQTILTLLLLLICFTSIYNSTVSASIEPPWNNRASAYLEATNLYTDATSNILHMINLMGVSPPSSNWFGPGNVPISPTCSSSGSLIRQYIYVGGGLYGADDYFYIKACNRPPGQYRVTNGLGFDLYFNIIDPNKYYYLPLLFN